MEIKPQDIGKDFGSDDILEGEENIRKWIEDELKRLDEDACK